MRSILTAALLVFSAASQADVSAIYGRCLPTGSVSASEPLLSWKLTPTGGGHVSRVEMLLNNRPVAAEFHERASAVEYRPAQPLSGGLYTVTCRVTIERELIVRQDWSFEVSGDADATGPSNSFAANYALEATNLIRNELGLPAYILDHRMSAAADAHSKYQILNGQTCHMEEPGKPGFTGKAPWDRVQHFGFPGTCYEGTCGNQMDPRKAIRLLFDAPYHRVAFLQPGSPQVGIGFEGGSLTVDYAVSNEEGVGVSPSAGQTGTPLAWDGNESPSPLRVHGASGTVGYPIVFGWYSPSLENIRVSSMRLLDPGGNEVPVYVNTPDNDDELRFAAVMTPKAKLQPKTTYTAEVRATTQRGQRIDRTWRFTTGS